MRARRGGTAVPSIGELAATSCRHTRRKDVDAVAYRARNDNASNDVTMLRSRARVLIRSLNAAAGSRLDFESYRKSVSRFSFRCLFSYCIVVVIITTIIIIIQFQRSEVFRTASPSVAVDADVAEVRVRTMNISWALL